MSEYAHTLLYAEEKERRQLEYEDKVLRQAAQVRPSPTTLTAHTNRPAHQLSVQRNARILVC